MSGAPIESLYQPTQRTRSGTLWGPYHFTIFNEDTLLTVVTTLAEAFLPADSVLFVDAVHVRVTAGATQTIGELAVQILDANSNLLSNLFTWRSVNAATFDSPGGVSAVHRGELSPPVALVTGNHFLSLFSTFSANANANRVQMSISGMIAPKANVAMY